MKIVNISSFISTILVLVIPTQVLAQEVNAQAGSAALVRVNQGSTTENTSNVGGTVNNVGVNQSSGLLIPGRTTQGTVSCEVPVFEASAGMTNPGNGFSTTQAIIFSFRTPLGGQAQANCVAHSGVVLRQAELDTILNLINYCQEMTAKGVVFNDTAPAELIAACNMIEN